MKEPREVFKENLQYFLRINGFSQADMARKMKVSQKRAVKGSIPLSRSRKAYCLQGFQNIVASLTASQIKKDPKGIIPSGLILFLFIKPSLKCLAGLFA